MSDYKKDVREAAKTWRALETAAKRDKTGLHAPSPFYELVKRLQKPSAAS